MWKEISGLTVLYLHVLFKDPQGWNNQPVIC